MCSKPIKAQIDFRKELTKYMYHLNFFKIYIIRPISNQLSNNLILPGLKKERLIYMIFNQLPITLCKYTNLKNVHSYRFFLRMKKIQIIGFQSMRCIPYESCAMPLDNSSLYHEVL